jgi:hypothetical protein
MKILLFLFIFLSASAITYARHIDDKSLFQQILPNKYLVNVSATEKQFPAAEEIEVNGETLLACCYRDNKPEDSEYESGQPIHIAFFKKEKNGFFRLMNQPNPIKYSDATDEMLQPWIESVPVNQKTQAIVVTFHCRADATVFCVFDYENNRLRFLDTKVATEFEMKDLNNDGEKELIFTNHEFSNIDDPPIIFRIINSTLVDASSHFPVFYKKVIDEYDEMLQSGNPGSDVIKMLKLNAYEIIDDPNKKTYGEQLKSEINNEISKLKSNPDWKIVNPNQPAYKPEDRKALNMNNDVKRLERDLDRVNKIIGSN